MIPRLRRMRRRVPKHRRPPPRGLLRRQAGAALAAGGVLAAAFGIGGWALAGRPAGYGRAGSPGAAGPTVPVPHSRDAGHPGPAGQRLVARPVRLVIPASARWMPVLTPLAAAALALESLALAVLYARYSLALTASNPLVYVVVIGLTAVCVAYGRYALRPPA